MKIIEVVFVIFNGFSFGGDFNNGLLMSQFSLDASESTSLPKEEPSYQQEIASMMHGFGDSALPNEAAVALVESIVLQQLRLMLREAAANADLRKNPTITNTDMVHLFRNNKVKLKRLHGYFTSLEMIKNHTSSVPTAIDDEDASHSLTTRTGGRISTIEAINNLDTTGEIQSISYDEEKHARLARQARLTESMSLTKYEAYYKARTVSFGKPGFLKSQQKFRAWLNPNDEFNIGQTAYDILVYLAFETVAEIVDLVFLVRQDARRKTDDPFSKYGAGNYCNPVSLSNAVYVKSGQEGVPPITVAEVREVMRRIYAPRVGVAGLFYRNMKNELPAKYIAI